jgi:hypothetical protein
MAAPPIPPSLEHLEHNEWLFRKATWSEILVVNCKTSNEIWIPRRFIGEVSRIDDPVLIVGLNRELEYKAGAVWPYQRRIIEMPVAVGGIPLPPSESTDRGAPAPIVGIRLESSDKRIFRLIGIAVALAIGLYIVAVNLNRVGKVRQRTVVFTARDEVFRELGGRDTYFTVVQKLGQPASDRWASESGALQFRALSYPDRRYTVILMGGDRNSALYIGTVDDNWKPVHSVPLHAGGTTASALKGLRRF